MLTSQSPRTVMLLAHRLAQECLPDYSSKFSRHQFTLAQLFACLVLKEHQGRSYRGSEALLRDSPEWCRAIGLIKPPDHNTLCRAARRLMHEGKVSRLLDLMAHWAARQRKLGLSRKPLAVDSSCFEPRTSADISNSDAAVATVTEEDAGKSGRCPSWEWVSAPSAI
jgi:hypothetical protein